MNNNMNLVNKQHISWADIVDQEEKEKNQEKKVYRRPTPVPRQSFTPIPSTTFVRFSKQQREEKVVDEVSAKYISENISLVDSLGQLKMFHYLQCDESSDDTTKQTRGVVRNGDKIICKTFGFSSEFSSQDIETITKKMSGFSQCKFFESKEGAMIRLFFFGGYWHVATHRRLNAFQSKWGIHTDSFGDMFVEALDWESQYGSLKEVITVQNPDELLDCFCNLLDQKKTYTFLVCNNDLNRIVCHAPEHPTVYFIGSFDASTHMLVEGNDSHISFPPSHSFTTLEELCKFVDTCDWKTMAGITVYMPNQTQMKITSPTYLKYFVARGNEPSIKYRYLQVRTNPESVKMLMELYPAYQNDFVMYEDFLIYVAQCVAHAYNVRYVQKQFIRVPQEQYFVLQHCLEIVSSPQKEKLITDMSPSSILKYMNTLNATNLNHLVKTCFPPTQ